MSDNLSTSVKITRVSNAVAAGSTDSNSSSVDMNGFDGVMFIASLGTLTASQVTQLQAQTSSDDGVGDSFANLSGTQTTAMADDDDNQLVVLDVVRPQERYVRCVVERATANAVIDGVIAIQYLARYRPTTHDAATVSTTTTKVI